MKRYSLQKIGNLFIVKASIGRLNAQPSIVQLLVDTGASQTGLPRSSRNFCGFERSLGKIRFRPISLIALIHQGRI